MSWVRGLRLNNLSWPIIGAVVALMVMGIATIHGPSPQGAKKQLVFAVMGLGAIWLMLLVPYLRLGRLSFVLFGISLLLLMALMVDRYVINLPLIERRGPGAGAHRWIVLPGFLVQVSELAKITFILTMAWYLRYRDNYRQLKGLIPPFLLALLPVGLILKQPDLGTALLFFPTLLAMLWVAGARIKHVLIILLLTVLMLCLMTVSAMSKPWGAALHQAGWSSTAGLVSSTGVVLQDYQQRRIRILFDQYGAAAKDRHWRQNQGKQLHESKIAIGSGGLFGKGWLQSTHVIYNLLPEDHTDFIYAIIGEQWGFVGCLTVLLLYSIIFFAGAEIAGTTDEPFGRLIVCGVLALLATQMLINVGMTVGLTPITGVTLPLISYGGSSLIVNCVLIGLLLNVAQSRKWRISKKSFEYRE